VLGGEGERPFDIEESLASSGGIGVRATSSSKRVEVVSLAGIVQHGSMPGSAWRLRGGASRERLDCLGLWVGAASLSLLLLTLPSGPSRVEWLRLGGTLGLAASVAMLAIGRARDPWIDRAVLAALLLTCASYAAAIAFSRWPEASVQRSLGIPFATLAGIVGMRIGGDPAAFRLISWASIAAVLLLVVDLAWQGWTERSLLAEIPTGRRRQGSLANPNDLAMVVPLVALGFSDGGRSRWSGWMIGLVGLAAGAFVQRVSDSRGLAIGLAALIAAWVMMRLPRRGRWTLAGLVAVMVGTALLATSERQRVLLDELVAWFVPGGEAGSVDGIAEQLATLAEASHRPAMFAVAWAGFVESPWLGVGPGLFAEEWWHRRGGVPWGTVAPSVGYMPWTHNLYLEAIGGLAFLLLVLAPWCAVWRATRGRPIDPRWRPTLVSSTSALAGIMVMGLVDLTLLKDWVSLVLMTSVGLTAGASSALRSAAEADESKAQGEHRA